MKKISEFEKYLNSPYDGDVDFLIGIEDFTGEKYIKVSGTWLEQIASTNDMTAIHIIFELITSERNKMDMYYFDSDKYEEDGKGSKSTIFRAITSLLNLGAMSRAVIRNHYFLNPEFFNLK